MAKDRGQHTRGRSVALVGLLITAVVAGCAALGLLDGLERQTLDLRFRFARMSPPAMSDEIRHVDIDDQSIETVGRWPWPRSRLAQAIDEMARAGASVVALDILFDNPQAPTIVERDGGAYERVDHDAALAGSIREANAVVALRRSEEVVFDEVWRGARGEAELSALLRTLGQDVTLTPADAAERAGLTGARRARFLARPARFKEVAASRRAAEMFGGGGAPPEDAFIGALAPSVDRALVASFPEEGMLRRVHGQWLAWLALSDTLVARDGSGEGDERFASDRAPVPGVAEAAAGAGFVDFEPDADGTVRRLRARRDVPTGQATQFGLVSAGMLRGVGAREIGVGGDAVTVGDVLLPARGGELLLDWPRTADGWLGMMREGDGDARARGRLSIGALIDLSDNRAKLAGNEAQLERQTRELLLLDDDEAVTAGDIEEARSAAEESLEAGAGDLEELLGAYLMLERTTREGREYVGSREREVREMLEGRLVFVGWTATGALADFVKTPLGSKTPGVALHAVVADMALTGRATRVAPGWAAPVMALLLGLLAALAAQRLGPVASSLAALGMLVVYIASAGWWAFDVMDLAAPIAAPVMAGGLSWVGCTALDAALSQRERQRITRQFKARVSAQLVDALLENPGALSMEGEQREMTMMFVDLAGFTSLSEQLDGARTVAILNRCMRENTRVLTEERAYVNKFLGDGLMAFWSAFAPDPEQAARACRAAVRIQETIAALRDDPMFEGLPPIRARVGIATGVVVVGDCGAPPELNDYTVIGDAVNLASRLESASKQFGARVLLDGRTAALLGEGHGLRLRPYGRVVVVGQTTPVEVFELLGADVEDARIEATARAVEKFCAGEFDECARLFDELAARYGDEKLAAAFREGIEAAREPGADGFDGALRLRSK